MKSRSSLRNNCSEQHGPKIEIFVCFTNCQGFELKAKIHWFRDLTVEQNINNTLTKNRYCECQKQNVKHNLLNPVIVDEKNFFYNCSDLIKEHQIYYIKTFQDYVKNLNEQIQNSANYQDIQMDEDEKENEKLEQLLQAKKKNRRKSNAEMKEELLLFNGYSNDQLQNTNVYFDNNYTNIQQPINLSRLRQSFLYQENPFQASQKNYQFPFSQSSFQQPKSENVKILINQEQSASPSPYKTAYFPNEEEYQEEEEDVIPNDDISHQDCDSIEGSFEISPKKYMGTSIKRRIKISYEAIEQLRIFQECQDFKELDQKISEWEIFWKQKLEKLSYKTDEVHYVCVKHLNCVFSFKFSKSGDNEHGFKLRMNRTYHHKAVSNLQVKREMKVQASQFQNSNDQIEYNNTQEIQSVKDSPIQHLLEANSPMKRSTTTFKEAPHLQRQFQ